MKKCNHSSAGLQQRKQALLPQIIKLAQEGRSSREIGEKVGVSKSTIAEWLREIQPKSATKQSLDAAEAIRKRIEHFRSISDELLKAWRLSQAEKQVRLLEETGPAGDLGAAKKKRSVRTESQTGNASYLAKAMDAENKIDILEQRLAALEGTEAGAPGGRPVSLANLTDDDLENLTPDDLENFNDDQLFIIQCRLRAKYERNGVKFDEPLLTNEELANMNDEQLTALEIRLQNEMDGLAGNAPTRETEGMPLGDPEPPCEADPQKCLAEPGPRPAPAAAETAGAVAAICGPVEKPEKVDAPPLTWAQKHAALLREAAEKKQRWKRYTDPAYCAYRGG